MLKAYVKRPGRKDLFVIGLTFKDLDLMRAAPGDDHITIDGEKHRLPVDIMIFASATEPDLVTVVAGAIGPDTQIHIDPHLKS